MTKQLIITGGASIIAQEIVHFWSKKHEDWKIYAPPRQELDVTDHTNIRDYFHSRECDLLICCAGYAENQILGKATLDSWEKTMAINLDGAAACALAVIPSMQRNNTGHIIFLSSYAAIRPAIGQAAYAASKAGLIGLGKSLAAEWGQFNIRVNTILPGWIDSPMTRNVSPQRHAQVMSEHVLERFNTTQAVAAFISTLHEDLIHTSGQCFALDSRIS